MPLSFEANQGQADPSVNFLARGSGYTVFLTPEGAVLALQNPGSPGNVVQMQLGGGSITAQPVALDPLAGTSNYLLGNDPSQWITNVPTYGQVEYQNIYPGVNLVYHGNQQQLEYDFAVTPGASVSSIQLVFQGTTGMTLDSQGNLVLHTSGGDVIEQAPVLYQDENGVQRTVSGHYVIEANGDVGFAVGPYDTAQTLVIDPILTYSTYLGGSGNDEGLAIAVDSGGNVYAAGQTASADFPTHSPLQGLSGSTDAFVTKLDAAGTGLIYSTYLGGGGDDAANGIAVDATGNVYLTGFTTSTNFPTKNPLQGSNGGGQDAFVAKLNASGTALVYSTYLGGGGTDSGNAIAVDGAGNVYVAGSTSSTDFPTKNPLQGSNGGGQDAFVAKLNASGTALVYSTYLGGSGTDSATGIAIDSSGNAYVSGTTASTDFPTVSALQGTLAGGKTDAFVAKLNASGTALLYSTYLGGSGDDTGNAIAVDGSGDAYITGSTKSANFPTHAALQTSLGGTQDAFVTELNASGTALVYSTYLGGSGTDGGNAIALDSGGNAYVAGSTTSTDFPTASAVQGTKGGGTDAFVAKLSAGGTALLYSTYLGGSLNDSANGIALDGSGSSYVIGTTLSTDFPTVSALQGSNAGGTDAFIAKIGGGGLDITAPANVTAGKSFQITVTAVDGLGNTITSYQGTVHFQATGSATLPGDYTFVSSDDGSHVFTVTLGTPGSQTLTVLDTVNKGFSGTAPIQVSGPTTVTHFSVTGPSSVTAGASFMITVTALDQFNSVVTDYTGTIHFTCTDSQATLPADYTFMTSDKGVKQFPITMDTAGDQTIAVIDVTNSFTGRDTIPVNPAAAFDFLLTTPAGTEPNAPFSATVTVEDQFGNIVTGYGGTIKFSSSDTQAVLPGNYPFVSGDNGSHAFVNALILKTIGDQTVTVTDISNSKVTGSATIDVNPPLVAVGADAGGPPTVNVYNTMNGNLETTFPAYDTRFLGGVRVALGDVNGDGIPDIITAPGITGGPDIRVFDGETGKIILEFMAYDPRFLGGVFVAAADINHDGHADIITAPDAPGGPDVRVWEGATGQLIQEFMAFPTTFLGGVRVATGDVNHDGVPDIIAGAGPGGLPQVRVFSGVDDSLLQSFNAYDSRFTGGIYVAAGDINGDGHADIITGPASPGGPDVRVFDGSRPGVILSEFYAYDSNFLGGVRVGTISDPITGDEDIVTGAGPSGGPHVKVFDSTNLVTLDSFYAFSSSFTGGVMVGGL
jgi:hypothetical protein